MTASKKASGKKAKPAPATAERRADIAEGRAMQEAEAREAETVAAFKAARDDAAAVAPAGCCPLAREFFTAGRAVFTVEPPRNFIAARRVEGEEWHEHYTFGVRVVEFDDGRTKAFVDSFVAYEKPVYLGVLDATTGAVRLTQGSKFPADATRVKVVTKVLRAVWEGRAGQIAAAGWRVMHDGRCSRCRRQLTDPASLDRGVGPDCWEMMCAAAKEREDEVARF